MTTPSVTVFSHDFTADNGSAWTPSGEWTTASGAAYSGYTIDIQNNQGRLAPPTVTAASGDFKIMTAMAWKDPKLTYYEIECNMQRATTGGTGNATASNFGILFNWDGNVASPTCYVLSLGRWNPTATDDVWVLSRIVAGTRTFMASAMGGSSAAQTVVIRVSLGLLSNRIEFRTTLPSNFNSDPGAGGFIPTTNNTAALLSGGYIAIANIINGTSGIDAATVNAVTPSKWVACDSLTIRRIAGGSVYPSEVPTVSVLTSGANGVDAATFATASISPTVSAQQDRMWLAFVSTSANAGNTHTLSGCSLTWASISTTTYALNGRRLTAFSGTGTPTAGALTIGNSGSASMTGGVWVILEVTGASRKDSSTFPVASLDPIPYSAYAAGSSTAPSVTIGTGGSFPDATADVLVIAAGAYATTVAATGSLTTDLSSPSHSSPNSIMTVSHSALLGATAISQTLASSVNWAIIGLVIQPSVRYHPDELEGVVSTGPMF